MEKADNRIIWYFITCCSGFFSATTISIFINHSSLFEHRFIALCIIFFAIITVFVCLLTLYKPLSINEYTLTYHFLKTIGYLIIPLAAIVYLQVLRGKITSMSWLELLWKALKDINMFRNVYFDAAITGFIATSVSFICLLISLLFTEPTKQKITEQPTTTATQAKTSYHIQVIPKNCGQPLIPSLIYC